MKRHRRLKFSLGDVTAQVKANAATYDTQSLTIARTGLEMEYTDETLQLISPTIVVWFPRNNQPLDDLHNYFKKDTIGWTTTMALNPEFFERAPFPNLKYEFMISGRSLADQTSFYYYKIDYTEEDRVNESLSVRLMELGSVINTKNLINFSSLKKRLVIVGVMSNTIGYHLKSLVIQKQASNAHYYINIQEKIGSRISRFEPSFNNRSVEDYYVGLMSEFYPY